MNQPEKAASRDQDAQNSVHVVHQKNQYLHSEVANSTLALPSSVMLTPREFLEGFEERFLRFPASYVPKPDTEA
ncbi:hypothetical protein MTR_7g023775 [Medicago truncatula]|uniref:Uncharacterized protein n=1 Tax=Medicago truncatula TaxID=3880 RepID=A0A072TYJ0_MEDTR|nr:hypothetical protein MTR_7g023775 [Medicago truncatula]